MKRQPAAEGAATREVIVWVAVTPGLPYGLLPQLNVRVEPTVAPVPEITVGQACEGASAARGAVDNSVEASNAMEASPYRDSEARTFSAAGTVRSKTETGNGVSETRSLVKRRTTTCSETGFRMKGPLEVNWSIEPIHGALVSPFAVNRTRPKSGENEAEAQNSVFQET